MPFFYRATSPPEFAFEEDDVTITVFITADRLLVVK